MEVVIDFEFLRGRRNEIVVKDFSVEAKNMIDSFRSRAPIA